MLPREPSPAPAGGLLPCTFCRAESVAPPQSCSAGSVAVVSTLEHTPGANSLSKYCFPCFITTLNPHVYIGQPSVTLYSYSHGHAHLGPYMPRIAPSASPVDLDSCRVQRLVKAPSRQRVHPHTSTSERESTTFTLSLRLRQLQAVACFRSVGPAATPRCCPAIRFQRGSWLLGTARSAPCRPW